MPQTMRILLFQVPICIPGIRLNICVCGALSRLSRWILIILYIHRLELPRRRLVRCDADAHLDIANPSPVIPN